MSKTDNSLIQTLLKIKEDSKKSNFASSQLIQQVVDLAIQFKLEADGAYKLWNAEPSEYKN